MPKYTINVAKMQDPKELCLGITPGYAHFFKVESTLPQDHVKKVYESLKSSYPEPEYKISVFRDQQRSELVNFEGEKNAQGYY